MVGSNIANIGLILGLTAIAYPLRVESETLKREFPMLMLIMIASFIMAADLMFNRTEGWLLLTGLAALIIWMVRYGMRRGTDDPLAVEFEAEIPRDMPTRYAVIWLLVGLVILPLSSTFLVEGAVYIARSLHVSEAVIGLTIIALGTSLPELAAALTSALRQEDDLAIGNVIGSNMFNILGVLGIAIATVILPNLSAHSAADRGEAFGSTLDWALRTVLIIGVPAAAAPPRARRKAAGEPRPSVRGPSRAGSRHRGRVSDGDHRVRGLFAGPLRRSLHHRRQRWHHPVDQRAAFEALAEVCRELRCDFLKGDSEPGAFDGPVLDELARHALCDFRGDGEPNPGSATDDHGVDADNLAGLVLHHLITADDVGVAQPNHLTRRKPFVFARRINTEVLPFDHQVSGEGDLTLSEFRLLWVPGRT